MKPSYEELEAQLRAALFAEHVWEKTMMEACGEDGPASVAAEIKSLRELRDTALESLCEQVRQLTEQRDAVVVESNTNLQSAARELNTSWMMHRTMLGAQAALLCLSYGDIKAARDWLEGTTDEAFAEMSDDMTPDGLQAWYDSNMISNDGGNGFLTHEEALEKLRQRAPATSDAIAALRAEGAHFVANRMLAAWEAGFIDDTAKNAADIARMILTSTEFMAEALAGDFDRSFADSVLDDIARQLRESKGEVQS